MYIKLPELMFYCSGSLEGKAEVLSLFMKCGAKLTEQI
jgi:hypothetical protein